MAKIKTADKDTRYAHLNKLYTDKVEEVKIVKTEEKIEFKKEVVTISRKQMLTDAAIVAGLFVVGLSGYLLFRFV
jgi:hypothetical protein